MPSSPRTSAAHKPSSRSTSRTRPYDLAGFSFGGIVAGRLAAREGGRVKNLVLLGAGGFGSAGSGRPTALRRLASEMDIAGLLAVHRHNLAALMIADPGRVDDLAVYLQIENTRRARARAGEIPVSDSLLRALAKVKARIHGIWGRRDSMVGDLLEDRAASLRRFQPDLDFRVIDDAGHWTPYETEEPPPADAHADHNRHLRDFRVRELLIRRCLPSPQPVAAIARMRRCRSGTRPLAGIPGSRPGEPGRDAVTRATQHPRALRATELNARLNAERFHRGCGLTRAGDRILWSAPFAHVPDGAVVADVDGTCHLVRDDRLLRFAFDGWGTARPRPSRGIAIVLTPPTSVTALANGYLPALHASAKWAGGRYFERVILPLDIVRALGVHSSPAIH